MTDGWALARVTDGTAQSERMPYALETGFFLPQERKLHDHLAYLAHLARLIRLPGLGSAGTETWARLFQAEPAVAIAELLSLQVAECRLDFSRELGRTPDDAVRLIHRRAGRLRSARRALERNGTEFALIVKQMEAVGDEISTDQLLDLLATSQTSSAGRLVMRVAPQIGMRIDGDPIRRAEAAKRALTAVHEQLLNVHVALRPSLEEAFEARLTSGRVDPALGLVVSQLRLLGEAEERINGFVDRHTWFYYRDVLGLKPREATPETILLRFAPSGAPVWLDAGTMVKGRVAGTPELQAYRLIEPVRAVKGRIGASRALVYDRNSKISMQKDLGFVTGIRAATREVDGRGASQRLFDPQVDDDLALGMDISSDMLRLAEGRRSIRLVVRMRNRHEFDLPDPTPEPAMAESGSDGVKVEGARSRVADPTRHDRYRTIVAMAAGRGHGRVMSEADLAGTASMVEDLAARRSQPDSGISRDAEIIHHAMLKRAKTADQVREIYGHVVAEAMVEGGDWPQGEFRELLLTKIGEHLDGPDAPADAATNGTARSRAEAWFSRSPMEVYQEIFLYGAMRVNLSTAEGFFAVPTLRATPNREGDGPGFTLHMQLDPSMPPIVPLPDGDRPVMQVRLAGGSVFNPFSMFERYSLDDLTIDVSVSGIQHLVGFSDDGPLNLAQPFYPFGARPKDGAEFLVGSREMALKPVTRVSADLLWSELPRGAGGFEEYYAGYQEGFVVPDPHLIPSYLTGDGWKPLGNGPVPMTERRTGIVTLVPERTVAGQVPGRPVAARSGTRVEDFRQRQSIRAGLMRFTLDCPGVVFGHTVYPAALSWSMRPLYLPGRKRPIPQEPYTPEISQISLSYDATERFVFSAPQAAAPGQKVVQINPFGSLEIYPKQQRTRAGLFPEQIADGSLFLRIDGVQDQGAISLLFDMEDSSHKRVIFEPQSVVWFYLSTTGWARLPSDCMEADSTEGYMRSGVVRCRIPKDASFSSTEMPGNGAWLAVCAYGDVANFPQLESVTMNGAQAVRADIAAEGYSDRMPQAWQLDPPMQGIAEISRAGEVVGGIPPEEKQAFRTRVSERLRHGKRAVVPWDYERLVLDAFPEVWKAKCFPAMDQRQHQVLPESETGGMFAPDQGSVTVIVVPKAPENASDDPTEARMFDVLTLRRIEQALQAAASPFARVQVSNPSFERLQIRSVVKFAGNRDDGHLTQRLKLDVSRYLSVWTGRAPLSGFGWRLNLRELGAFMQELDYVEFINGLAVLQRVNNDSEYYRLVDTARLYSDGGGGSEELRFHRPWGLTLPMRDHEITTTTERSRDRVFPAGVGSLRVGGTLVVQGSKGTDKGQG